MLILWKCSADQSLYRHIYVKDMTLGRATARYLNDADKCPADREQRECRCESKKIKSVFSRAFGLFGCHLVATV